MMPSPGEVVLVGRAASVQFTGRSGFAFRIIAVDSRPTYDGWVWLDGYQLDRRGQAGPAPDLRTRSRSSPRGRGPRRVNGAGPGLMLLVSCG